MSTIAKNTEKIRSSIAQAAASCGRNPEEITLMAVTKTRGIDEIREVLRCGITCIGENRVQELQQKAPLLGPAEIHLIGPLQSNKVKPAVLHSCCIQTVEREKILALIGKNALAAEKTIGVMIEVNTSGEENKHGVKTDDDVYRLIDQALDLEGTVLTGLMTMGPLAGSRSDIRKSFSSLFQLRERIAARYPDLSGKLMLSMGMSGDYDLAVLEGSDLLRIGSAFFS